MRPQAFACSITPRTEQIRETIKREGRQAVDELEQYRGETQYRMSTFFYQRGGQAVARYGDEKQ